MNDDCALDLHFFSQNILTSRLIPHAVGQLPDLVAETRWQGHQKPTPFGATVTSFFYTDGKCIQDGYKYMLH